MSLRTPFGDFSLRRYPQAANATLRAWSSADRLLLQAAAANGTPAENILVVNDEHGALAIPLAGCCVWTDSRLSELAILANLESNRIRTQPRLCPMDRSPHGRFDLVLLRIPKQMSLLRYQLQRLRELLAPGCSVICAGMDKHLPRGVARLLEQFLGPAERHPGECKARCFTVTVDKSCTGIEPRCSYFRLPGLNGELKSRANVFSREKLDPGSRLMLTHFDRLPAARRVTDLGCGNGVLGLLAAQRLQPDNLVFVDESALALASARSNVERLLPGQLARCEFLQADGLLDYSLPAPDLILCNPPFHQQHVVDESSGQRLIRQAAAAIAPGGELWLVANRHLPYAGLLQRCFPRLQRLAENNKFILWRALAAGLSHPGPVE